MKIKQCSVAWCVRFFESGFLDKWKLSPYYSQDDPCFFLGVEQVKEINSHRGLKIIYPISKYDCSFLEQLEYSENIILINSPFLSNTTGYKIKDVEIELKDYSIFKPSILGDKIYCYIGMESRKDEFNYEKILSIQDKIEYEIIYPLMGSLYEFYPIEELKEKYYDPCFLSLNLSEGTGMTTVRELGLMGRKTITNSPYNFPSVIRYKDEEDIIRIIKEESEKIGTIQPPLDCHNIKNEWLDLNFWT